MNLRTYYKNKLYEAGCDEAGRGCLAGPVVAAVVILDPKKKIFGLNDSKVLTEKKRNLLRREIEEKALEFKVDFVDHLTIDQLNILQASLLAMHNSVKKLTNRVDHLIIDGNKNIPGLHINQTALIKGDGLYQSIAAASILAKTYRDEFMLSLHEEFPYYNWKQNKGYGSLEHRLAIQKYGYSIYHRLSFKLKDFNK